MKIKKYCLDAVLEYSKESIESFLMLCEKAIYHLSDTPSVRFHLKNAAHELVVNSIEHGYKKNQGFVSISLARIGDSIVFSISDNGCGLNMSKIDVNREANSYSDLSARGWGLSILNPLSSQMKIN